MKGDPLLSVACTGEVLRKDRHCEKREMMAPGFTLKENEMAQASNESEMAPKQRF